MGLLTHIVLTLDRSFLKRIDDIFMYDSHQILDRIRISKCKMSSRIIYDFYLGEVRVRA